MVKEAEYGKGLVTPSNAKFHFFNISKAIIA